MKVLSFVGILAMLWFAAHGSTGFAGDVAQYASRPFRMAFGYGYAGVRGAYAFFASRESLRRDVSALREENAHLRESLGELNTLRVERSGLYQALGNKEFSPATPPIPARVVGKGEYAFGQIILVDRGSASGVEQGDVVVTQSRLLVGLVAQVTPRHAEVQLLGNRLFRAAVKIVSPQPAYGDSPGLARDKQVSPTFIALARGEGFGNVTLDMIPADAMLNGGETILTSGFDGVYPPDIVVGKAGRLLSGPSDFFQRAQIEPLVDIGELETVSIIPHHF